MSRLPGWSGVVPLLVVGATFSFFAGPTLFGLGVGGDVFLHSERAEYARGSVPDAWLDGLAALRAGDHQAAHEQLALAESQLESAPDLLLRQRLHAALACGDERAAEWTVEKLAVRGSGYAESDVEPLRDFVFGCARAAQSQRYGLEAEQPGADPTAFDRAIRDATAAALAFQSAALAAPDTLGPAARRNAERVLLRRGELQRKQDLAERDRKREQDQQQPEPDPDTLEQIEQELRLTEDQGLLSATELQALLRRLAEAEQEKRGIRRAVRERNSTSVEQDW